MSARARRRPYRPLAVPFVVAPPPGIRIRTRLRPSVEDERALREVGAYLGGLAGRDLADRCRIGSAKDTERTRRKRDLTLLSSSRWAGAITRTSEDQWQRGWRNLLDQQPGLWRAVRTITRRLAVPAGGRQGRVRGYATREERAAKRQRLQHLQARRVEVERRIEHGQVSVVRGGRRLLNTRHHLQQAKLTKEQWRQRWEAERWFLTADGEADKHLGNETIRVHPEQGWLEVKLPAPLAHLANRPRGRYRLSCPVAFFYHTNAWAAQVATGAVRFDITFDPSRGRWYLGASWKTPPRPPVASVGQALSGQVLAVDVNAEHLACWVVDPSGNPVGCPIDVPLKLDGMPASTRDGRLRAAISRLLALVRGRGCSAVVIEDLDFADARQVGRERMGRGRRGKRFRRTVAGLPTGQFRDRLAQMAANHGIPVVAVDPGWSSIWGDQHWRKPLRQQHPRREISRHHAACVVLGRRARGQGARRRRGMAAPHRRMEAAVNVTLTAGAESCPPGRASVLGRAGPDPPASHPGGSPGLRKTAGGDREVGHGPGGAGPSGATRTRHRYAS